MKQRAKELDFLRGIAILLVMLRHSGLSKITTQIGWIGVDLFFVLSGYLVSGLLFSEYQRNGRMKPFHFLIRRGFKIYPLFYLVLLLHIIYNVVKDIPLNSQEVLPEVFFFQNYVPGIMGISWSLAIEEHFYLLLSISLFLVSIRSKVDKSRIVPISCAFLAVACLALRILAWSSSSGFDPYKQFFPTHLRIDSLAFGVLISWMNYFHREQLHLFARRFRFYLMALLPFLFAPVFIGGPEEPLTITLGFSFLYLGFGIILLLMTVYTENIRNSLKRWHIRPVFDGIAWVGVYSYSIYLIHMKAGPMLANFFTEDLHQPSKVFFVMLFLFFNILTGYILSLLIEQPFLRLREKYFPRK